MLKRKEELKVQVVQSVLKISENLHNTISAKKND